MLQVGEWPGSICAKDGNQPFLELYAAKELGGLVARSSRPADRCGHFLVPLRRATHFELLEQTGAKDAKMKVVGTARAKRTDEMQVQTGRSAAAGVSRTLNPSPVRPASSMPKRIARMMNGASDARSPCWTSRNEGHPVANKRCEDEGDESDVT